MVELSESIVLGLDIGGANIKACSNLGHCNSIAFALWKSPQQLAEKLRIVTAPLGRFDRVAVTMTGELADCFETRREGVKHIVAAVLEGFAGSLITFYRVDNCWASADEAIVDPWSVAASNWRALAEYVASRIELNSLLIDIGSTTTDIIKLKPNQVITSSRTDLDRLQSGELIYTGVERSNVAGLQTSLYVDGVATPVVNEQFATMADVYTVLNFCAAEEHNFETSDGKSRSLTNCQSRLARCVACDLETLPEVLIRDIAKQIGQSQRVLIGDIIRSKLREFSCDQIILSGHGDFVLRSVLKDMQWSGQVTSLRDWFGNDTSRYAPAFAVACLAQDLSLYSSAKKSYP